MLNFDFKRSSRKCSQTDRELKPGEEFFSAVIDNDGATERRDYSAEAWEAPPENCIGWWKTKVPELDKGKIYWAPRHVLLAFFEHICNQPAESDTAYVTALLLTQKKILTLADTYVENEIELMHLKNRKDNEDYKIPVVDVTPTRLQQIQEELGERLFTDQPFELDDSEDDGVDNDADEDE